MHCSCCMGPSSYLLRFPFPLLFTHGKSSTAVVKESWKGFSSGRFGYCAITTCYTTHLLQSVPVQSPWKLDKEYQLYIYISMHFNHLMVNLLDNEYSTWLIYKGYNFGSNYCDMVFSRKKNVLAYVLGFGKNITQRHDMSNYTRKLLGSNPFLPYECCSLSLNNSQTKFFMLQKQ